MKFDSARSVLVCLSISCLCILLGCTADGKLYPVQGPLSQQDPPQVFRANMTGTSRWDHFNAKIGNGEAASCTLQRVRSSSTSDPVSIASAWDAVYGNTFYETHVLGTHDLYYWCAMTGNQGTQLRVEVYLPMVTEPNLSGKGVSIQPIRESLKGVLQDDKGNIYKFEL